MIKVSLAQLRMVSSSRPVGYLDDVISRGKLDGKVLLLDPKVYQNLCKKYSLNRPKELSRKAKVKNAAAAASRVFNAKRLKKRVTVSDEEQTRRLDICRGCEFFTGKTCLKCGCFLNWKTKLATEKCPIDKW